MGSGISLNREQQWMVDNLDDNMVVIAGAGSGKTLSLVERYNNLLDHGVDPESIILTTFGKEASEEIEERVNVDPDQNKLNIGTIHSLCRQILRQDYKDTNYSKAPRTKVGYGRRKFADSIIEDHMDEMNMNKRDYDLRDDIKFVFLKNVDTQRRKGNFPDESEASFDVLTQEDKNKIGQFSKVKKILREQFQEMYADYREKMYEKNVMDYGQMIFETWLLLKENDDVREEYARKYEHIMVDEAQDLNRIQYDIFKYLSGGENLVLIGDDSQCIYSFRGSDPSLMRDFKKEFDAKKVVFERNYRSYQEIVDVVNKINTKLDEAEVKSLLSNDGNNGNDSHPRVKHMSPQDVAHQVLQLVEEGYALEEIAILGRTNRDVEDYQKELERLTIPTRNAGNDDFIDRWDVNKAYAYLRAGLKKDDEAMERLMQNRNVYNIEQVKRDMNEDSLVEFMEDLSFNPKNISKKKARKLKNDMEFIESITPENAFEKIESKKFHPRGFTDSVEAMEDIYNNLGAEDFFNFMEIDREDTVTCATVHQAKGKEWDAVFVVNVDKGSFPREDDPEEKRIFYVACSRPKERLYVTYQKEPSEFVRWIGG